MQKSPFNYGNITYGVDFLNRTNDLKKLEINFTNLINTILISPRRWGKTSLIYQADKLVSKKHKDVVICHLDLFTVRTKQEFYEMFLTEVISKTSTKFEQRVNSLKMFLKNIIPKITLSPTEDIDFKVGVDWDEAKKNESEILNIVEKIAINKKIRLVICIDEFQNISFFKNALAFQKKLRSNWQKQKNVSYCLYGSKRHMMIEFFTKTSMPFYKFGDLIFLEKIKTEEWIKYIIKRFKKTGKTISKENATKLVNAAQCHSYYVQQLAHICWLNTTQETTEKIVDNSIDGLINQLSLLFHNLTDTLSNTQVNFLEALLHNVEKFTTQSNLKKFKLGSSANVTKIKKALEDREIIDLITRKITFVDPIYELWLKNYFFRMN